MAELSPINSSDNFGGFGGREIGFSWEVDYKIVSQKIKFDEIDNIFKKFWFKTLD